jgi:hypothetical protein
MNEENNLGEASAPTPVAKPSKRIKISSTLLLIGTTALVFGHLNQR